MTRENEGNLPLFISNQVFSLSFFFVLPCTFNTFSILGVFKLKLMIQVKIIFRSYSSKIGLWENSLSFVQYLLIRMRKKKKKKQHFKRNLLNEVNSSPSQSFRRRIFSKAIRFLHAAQLFTSAKGCQFNTMCLSISIIRLSG